MRHVLADRDPGTLEHGFHDRLRRQLLRGNRGATIHGQGDRPPCRAGRVDGVFRGTLSRTCRKNSFVFGVLEFRHGSRETIEGRPARPREGGPGRSAVTVNAGSKLAQNGPKTLIAGQLRRQTSRELPDGNAGDHARHGHLHREHARTFSPPRSPSGSGWARSTPGAILATSSPR